MQSINRTLRFLGPNRRSFHSSPAFPFSGIKLFCIISHHLKKTMPHILKNSIELDLKTKLIESGTTQTEIAEKLGITLSYVNRITKGREQIVNKTFVKIMDELGYDV